MPAVYTEVVYLALVYDLPHPGPSPLTGLSARRSVGMNGTRLSAVLDGQVVGYIEVEVFEDGERQSRHGGWADVGNLHVAGDYRRRGVATWLLGQAAEWLRLAQISRLLDYASLETGPEGPGGRDDDGVPGFPGRVTLHRAHPDQARLDPEPGGPGRVGMSSQMLAILPRLAAVFNRGTLLIDSDQPDGENLADYCTSAITNHYARIAHATAIDGRGYAFPYSDVAPAEGADQSARSPIRPRRCSR